MATEENAVTDDALAEMLSTYHERLEKTFQLSSLGEDAEDPSKMAEKVRKELLVHTGAFIAGIADLARNASSESVKLQACKFGIERVFGAGAIGEKEDGINRLINDLINGEKGKVGQSPFED